MTYYLLDTNIAAFVVNGRSSSTRQQYREHKETDWIAVSSIVEAEIRYGLRKSLGNRQVHTHMDSFLEDTEVVPWDSAAARSYAFLRAATEAQGLAFGALDLQIAAHALALGATLVTHDRVLNKASQFIPVVDWATDL